MVRHIVFFGLRPDVAEAQRNELMESLRGLKAVIPEIRHIEVMPDEIGGERSATFGLLSEFDDYEAMRRYQQHPDHQAAASNVFAHCEWVKAWDYTVAQ